MSPEERSLLDRTYKLAEENNSILRSIRRGNRISTALRVLYWVFIIAAAFGTYYFLQPYMNTMLNLYDQVQTGMQTIQGNIDSVKDTAKNLKGYIN